MNSVASRHHSYRLPEESFGIRRHYKAKEILGKGGSAVVHAATQVNTGTVYAIKCFKKSVGDVSAIRRELSLLTDLRHHPNIVTIHDFFHDETCNYIVLDYMNRGDLMGYVVAKKRLLEFEAKNIARGLLSAIGHCHALGIVHRDIKPDNLLIDVSGNVKLTDFGLSRKVTTERRAGVLRRHLMITYCGTKDYMSPEMLSGRPYWKEVDIWGVGIVIFIMLGGYHPFHHEKREVKEKQILNGEFSFYPPYFAEVSDTAVNVIKKMVVTDPSLRICARDSLQLPWITEEATIEKLTIEPTIEPTIKAKKLLKGRSWNPFRRRSSKHSEKKGNKSLLLRCSTETQHLAFI